MSGEANTYETPRASRHIRRHWPSVVRMASQTLLSSRTRTRKVEDFLFGQTGFARQAVERGQQPVQFARLGEKTPVKPHGFPVGKLPDLLNHVRRDHALNICLSPPPATANPRG